MPQIINNFTQAIAQGDYANAIDIYSRNREVVLNYFTDTLRQADYFTAINIYCVVPKIVHDTNNSGWTALHLIAQDGPAPAVEFLIKELHVDVNINTRGDMGFINWTPLHVATYEQKIETITTLLKLNANTSLEARYTGNNHAFQRRFRGQASFKALDIDPDLFSDVVHTEHLAKFARVKDAITEGQTKLLSFRFMERPIQHLLTHHTLTQGLVWSIAALIAGMEYNNKGNFSNICSGGAIAAGAVVSFGLYATERVVRSAEKTFDNFNKQTIKAVNIIAQMQYKLSDTLAIMNIALQNASNAAVAIQKQAIRIENIMSNLDQRTELIAEELYDLMQDGQVTLDTIRNNVAQIGDETGMALLTARNAIKQMQAEESLTAEHARKMLDRVNVDIKHHVDIEHRSFVAGACVIS